MASSAVLLDLTLKVKTWIEPILALYMAKVTLMFSLKKY